MRNAIAITVTIDFNDIHESFPRIRMISTRYRNARYRFLLRRLASRGESCITNLQVMKGPVTREQTTPCLRRQVARIRNNRYSDLGVESRTSFPTSTGDSSRRRRQFVSPAAVVATRIVIILELRRYTVVPLITVYDISNDNAA